MSRYRIQWKRPTQVCRNPQFVVNGFNRCDMDQGACGNCVSDFCLNNYKIIKI